ncbi:MAG: prephenate/arogenate dehydrogenase [Candidatus Margulisbacteria bacterium]|nr:prephenate/arogenate dehydrogenase [Candidatus Margulisiibacteriota bacterium]
MKIAIVGLGLIGGSIGNKLKDQNSKFKIIGIPRRKKTIDLAIKLGAIDEGTADLTAGVKEAEVVFICTPISLIIPTINRIAPYLKQGAIVTDVGSSKEQIVEQAEKIMAKGTFFVGGHPMAGKEKVKLEAAEADLFQGRTWILTPTRKTNPRAIQVISRLVVLLGGKVMQMDPKTHDLVVAVISHMPLAVAAALVNTIADEKKNREKMKKCAASGFRDTTRIASGDPELGIDMFVTNQKAVLKALGSFKKSLSRLEKAIKSGKNSAMAKELAKAKKFRDSIYR